LDRSRDKRRSITGVKDERKILQTIIIRKGNLIGHILHSNCLLKHVFEGEIEGSDWKTRKKR